MKIHRLTIALAAVIATAVFGVLTAVSPAEAQHWRHRHHHHPGPGYYFSYRTAPECWTELRTVRVHTRHGWRLRERPVRICR